MRSITKFLVCVLLLGISSPALPSKLTQAIDSTPIHQSIKMYPRTINQESIQAFKEQAEFNYSREVPNVDSFWQRWWAWLQQQISKFYENPNTASIVEILFYAFVIVILTYVILRMLGIEVKGLFYSNQAHDQMDFTSEDLNIFQQDLEKELDKSLQNKQYRAAIRFLYLISLKLLSSKDHITWQSGKTSREYLNEVQSSQVKPVFQSLNHYYEYAWYGNFHIDQKMMDEVNRLFANLEKAVN